MTTQNGGYMIEYNMRTNIPGVDGPHDFEAIVKDVQPPQIISRWRNAVNGKLSGKRTRLGMSVEEARTFSFMTEEHLTSLDLVQWDGDRMFEFFGVMLKDTDGTAWGEYHRVIGELSDIPTAPTQAEGGQDYTYRIYVNEWALWDVPSGSEPEDGWLIKVFDYRRELFLERRLTRGSSYKGYAGSQDINAAASGRNINPAFRELSRNHNQLLGRNR